METYDPYTNPSALQRYLNGDDTVTYWEGFTLGKYKAPPPTHYESYYVENKTPLATGRFAGLRNMFRPKYIRITVEVAGYSPQIVLNYLKDSEDNIISSEAVEV